MPDPCKDSSEPAYCLKILGDTELPVRRFYLEIDRSFAATGSDAGRAIDHLGVSRATFYRKLKELGLDA